MKLRLIVVRSPPTEFPWLVTAWDEYTIDENPTGWHDEVQKAIKTHKGENVRIVSVKLPSDTFDRAFDDHDVVGELVED